MTTVNENPSTMFTPSEIDNLISVVELGEFAALTNWN
jgi:hypothetical protein